MSNLPNFMAAEGSNPGLSTEQTEKPTIKVEPEEGATAEPTIKVEPEDEATASYYTLPMMPSMFSICIGSKKPTIKVEPEEGATAKPTIKVEPEEGATAGPAKKEIKTEKINKGKKPVKKEIKNDYIDNIMVLQGPVRARLKFFHCAPRNMVEVTPAELAANTNAANLMLVENYESGELLSLLKLVPENIFAVDEDEDVKEDKSEDDKKDTQKKNKNKVQGDIDEETMKDIQEQVKNKFLMETKKEVQKSCKNQVQESEEEDDSDKFVQ